MLEARRPHDFLVAVVAIELFNLSLSWSLLGRWLRCLDLFPLELAGAAPGSTVDLVLAEKTIC